jgi:hypothetical protein
MRKWHPNKLEIYTADLCLKKIGISRDIRTCIKRYLFDYKAVTDEYAKPCFASYYFGDVYEFFCTQRISLVEMPYGGYTVDVLDNLAIACLNAGLSVHYYVTIGCEKRCFNRVANRAKTKNFRCFTIGSYIHPKNPDVILCNLTYAFDDYDVEHVIRTSPGASITLLSIRNLSFMNGTIKSIKI